MKGPLPEALLRRAIPQAAESGGLRDRKPPAESRGLGVYRFLREAEIVFSSFITMGM